MYRRLWVTIGMLVIVASLVFTGCSKPAPSPAPSPAPTTTAPSPKPTAAPVSVKWDVALFAAKGHYWTAPPAEWAAAMEQATNGQWKITIHYSASLANTADAPDGMKAGTFQGASLGALYYPGKMPLMTVAELPFYWTDLKTEALITQESMNHPVLAKWMADKWDILSIFPNSTAPHDYIGNKPLTKVDDLKGLRLRVSGEGGKLLQKFGAVPTMFAMNEAYDALQRGTLDGLFTNISAMGGYKLQEVAKFTTWNIALTSGWATFGVKKSAYDALPAEFKAASEKWAKEKSVQVLLDADAKASAEFVTAAKAKLTVTEKLDPAERAKLVAAAQPVYDQWVADRTKEGLPGKEIMDYFMGLLKKYPATK